MTKVPTSQIQANSDLELKDQPITGVGALEFDQPGEIPGKKLRFALTSTGALKVNYADQVPVDMDNSVLFFDGPTRKLGLAVMPSALDVAKVIPTPPFTTNAIKYLSSIGTGNNAYTLTWVDAPVSSFPNNPSSDNTYYLKLIKDENGARKEWTPVSGAGLLSLSEDTNPTLGNPLKVGSHKIVKTNAAITTPGSYIGFVGDQVAFSTKFILPSAEPTAASILYYENDTNKVVWMSDSALVESALFRITGSNGYYLRRTNTGVQWVAGAGGGGGIAGITYNGGTDVFTNLIAGTNITLTASGNQGIVISAAGGGGGNSVSIDVAAPATGYLATLVGNGLGGTAPATPMAGFKVSWPNDLNNTNRLAYGFLGTVPSGSTSVGARLFTAILRGSDCRGFQAILEADFQNYPSNKGRGFNVVSLATTNNTSINVNGAIGYSAVVSGTGNINFVSVCEDDATRVHTNNINFLTTLNTASANRGYMAEIFGSGTCSTAVEPFLAYSTNSWAGTFYKAVLVNANYTEPSQGYSTSKTTYGFLAEDTKFGFRFIDNTLITGSIGYYSELAVTGFKASVVTGATGFNATAVADGFGTGYVAYNLDVGFAAQPVTGKKGFLVSGATTNAGYGFVADDIDVGLQVLNANVGVEILSTVSYPMILRPTTLSPTAVNGAMRVFDSGSTQTFEVCLSGTWVIVATN